ncbi:MAG: hypothetical protein ABSG32_08825 [Terriglobia bacterium]
MQNGSGLKDDAKTGKTAATPSQSEAVGKSKKGAGELPEDALSGIAGGGNTKPDAYDSY